MSDSSDDYIDHKRRRKTVPDEQPPDWELYMTIDNYGRTVKDVGILTCLNVRPCSDNQARQIAIDVAPENPRVHSDLKMNVSCNDDSRSVVPSPKMHLDDKFSMDSMWHTQIDGILYWPAEVKPRYRYSPKDRIASEAIEDDNWLPEDEPCGDDPSPLAGIPTWQLIPLEVGNTVWDKMEAEVGILSKEVSTAGPASTNKAAGATPSSSAPAETLPTNTGNKPLRGDKPDIAVGQPVTPSIAGQQHKNDTLATAGAAGGQTKTQTQDVRPKSKVNEAPIYQVPLATRDKNGSLIICPLCNEYVKNIERHALTKHLPFYIRPDYACWSCKVAHFCRKDFKNHVKKMHKGDYTGTQFTEKHLVAYLLFAYGFLYTVIRALDMQLPRDLVSFCNIRGYGMRNKKHVSGYLMSLASIVETHLVGAEVNPLNVDGVNINMASAIFTSWEAITEIMWHLPLSTRNKLKNELPINGPAGFIVTSSSMTHRLTVDRVIRYDDAHFHLPETLKAFHAKTLGKLPNTWKRYVPEHYKAGLFVANFCFIKNWKYIPAETSGEIFTVSVHPHDAHEMNKERWTELEGYLRQTNCVAIAECGIDYTSTKQHNQQEVFERQLRLSRDLNKPIVIHGRGHSASKEHTSEIHKKIREIAQDILPADTLVMLHSFFGTGDDAMAYIKVFQNCVLGIGPNALFDRRYDYMTETVTKIPLVNMTLETDSPKQNPVAAYRGDPGLPQYVVLVADELARILNCPTMVLLRMAGGTLRRFLRMDF